MWAQQFILSLQYSFKQTPCVAASVYVATTNQVLLVLQFALRPSEGVWQGLLLQ